MCAELEKYLKYKFVVTRLTKWIPKLYVVILHDIKKIWLIKDDPIIIFYLKYKNIL